MPSKKPPNLQSVVQALGNQGLTAKGIQMVASRISEMSLEEIEMHLFKRQPKTPEPRPEATSDVVALVAKLRTASRRRTNAGVLALIADELEEEGLLKSGRGMQTVGRETVAQWLARVTEIVPQQDVQNCLERLLQAYQAGTRLRRVK